MHPWLVRVYSITLYLCMQPPCDPAMRLPGKHLTQTPLCAQAAEFLAGQGFNFVANVVGGIDAYSLRVDPCVPRY